ncbi:MAG TPA: sugar phosphate nucleotidyltransferase [Cryomorphaceae bacterium]|nr:sugar phosphate nucleotidyltransferase [Cryomorphaceae bacterium]
MNIIIPMAGRGKRLRPHTLTVPKPLVKIAGKPIVQHLVEDIAQLLNDEPLEEIVFVTGQFGEEVENHLLAVAESLGARGKIAYQDQALGTAHAIWCGKEALKGKTIVAFADTLFKADFQLDPAADGMLWVKQIADPSSFGVVKLNEDGHIIDFVEKPKEFVSDLAMIGCYYFKEGRDLYTEIEYLIENEVMKGGEYQLPDALRRMTEQNKTFSPGKVDEWMDCGNAKVTVETSNRVLALKYPDSEIASDVEVINSIVIAPCYIGSGAKVINSVVGPNASIGSNTLIEDSRISHSLIQDDSQLVGQSMAQSMIGSFVKLETKPAALSLGDYNEIK